MVNFFEFLILFFLITDDNELALELVLFLEENELLQAINYGLYLILNKVKNYGLIQTHLNAKRS